jgi:hypothetical protein
MLHETLSQIHPSQKRAGGVTQGVGPEFKLHTTHTKRYIVSTYVSQCSPPVQILYAINKKKKELPWPRKEGGRETERLEGCFGSGGKNEVERMAT